MFILPIDNDLNTDTCPEGIKFKTVLCACSTLCTESVYSLKAIHP